MIPTVGWLIENLKQYPEEMEIAIKHTEYRVSIVEFAIIDFLKEENTLTIVVDDVDEDEEESGS